MIKKTLHSALLIFSLLATIACTATERIYFGTSDSPGIFFSDFDPATGTLSTPKLAIAFSQPRFVTIHPNGRYLYSTAPGIQGSKEGSVAAFKLNPDGTLSLLNRHPSGGQGACHVSTDSTGQCLMVANYGGGNVASFKIKSDGSLTPAQSFHQHAGSGTHPKRQKSPHAHSIFTNPENTFAYAPDLGIDQIMIYALDATNGKLTPHGAASVPGGAMGPRHMKWSKDGRVAYVLNELDLSVSVFKPSHKTGMLKWIKTCSTLPTDADKAEMSSSEIRIHPNGKFIYAANRDVGGKGRDSIAVFSASSTTNGFQQIEIIPAEVSIPRNFNIDPSGNWLIVGGKKSHDIVMFKLNSETGRIQYTGTKVPFEGGPICIEFMPQAD